MFFEMNPKYLCVFAINSKMEELRDECEGYGEKMHEIADDVDRKTSIDEIKRKTEMELLVPSIKTFRDIRRLEVIVKWLITTKQFELKDDGLFEKVDTLENYIKRFCK